MNVFGKSEGSEPETPRHDIMSLVGQLEMEPPDAGGCVLAGHEKIVALNSRRAVLQICDILDAQKVSNTLVRSRGERTASWNELFFDLIFVAIISRLTHELRHAPTVGLVGWYLLEFTTIWVMWRDFTIYVNKFESSDVIHKLFIVVVMLSIVLAGVHMSSAVLFSATGGRIFSACLFSMRTMLVLMHLNIFWFVPNVAFLLTLQTVLPLALSAILYFVAIFVDDLVARIALWTLPLLLDVFWAPLVVLFVRRCLRCQGLRDHKIIPFAIEHIAERFGLFTIVVLGEHITACLFDATSGETAYMYLVATFGLVSAASLQWIYFDVEAGEQRAHAIRRNWFTGIVWQLAHLPLAICISISGGGLGEKLTRLAAAAAAVNGTAVDTIRKRSALAAMIDTAMSPSSYSTTDYSMDVALLTSIGYGGALMSIGAIGMTHQSFTDYLIDWKLRIGLRFVVGMLICLVPLITLNAALSTGLYAGALFLVLAVELYGARLRPHMHSVVALKANEETSNEKSPTHTPNERVECVAFGINMQDAASNTESDEDQTALSGDSLSDDDATSRENV